MQRKFGRRKCAVLKSKTSALVEKITKQTIEKIYFIHKIGKSIANCCRPSALCLNIFERKDAMLRGKYINRMDD
jgi:hypothetical protein